MRVAILGAGPAGLYAAYLIRRRLPDWEVEVFEQNAADATFGFGVVFSDRALEFLRRDDEETYAAVTPHLESWEDITLRHPGGTVRIDGVGFAAIGRLKLLQILQERVQSVGIAPHFGNHVQHLDALGAADLVIAADGANSLVRSRFAEAFGTEVTHLTNRFAWFGTSKTFDTLTQTFKRTELGHLNAHHYRYAPDRSTFIVEMDEATFSRGGFEAMGEDETRAVCEQVFAEELEGHGLISNKSVWRRFPKVRNRYWSHDRYVLVGDALRTAHFSIGSGTRLAMEDVIALVDALAGHPADLGAALGAYEAVRRPIVEKLLAAADASADWYEDFARHIALDPLDFAMSYITRSGRVDFERLRAVSPAFCAQYEAAKGAARPGPIADPVSDETPGAREIGFAVPERYNAGAILFDNLENGNADRVAIRGAFGQLTYAELARLASRAGGMLLDRGLGCGDRVLLLLDDTPACPAFHFGAIRAGLVPVIVNTLTPPDLLKFYLEDSGARAIVLEASLVGQLTEEAIAGTALETAILVNGKGRLDHVETVLIFDADPSGEDTLPAVDTHRDDMAFWLYSSGSTGRPKAIVHLQHDMAYTAESYARHILRLTADDTCFSVPKIFFAYGLGNSLTFPFSVGASSVLLAGRPEPEAVFDAIRTHRPTVFFGLPTLYTALAKSEAAGKADLSSLRLAVSAAEILSAEVAAAWQDLGGQEIVEGLGSTEVLHIYLSNTETRKRHGSAGRRVPGYEVRLLDREGREVADGEEGILWVRGQSTAPFYWNRPDKTAETMRGDWIYTGDRFVRDADGFHTFRGRADDLIKVSGQWVYPLEVELCLAEHPAVTEVAVLGIELPDRRMTLKAFAVPADSSADRPALARELQEHVKRTLLPYKYPRIVEFLDALPKTGTGKIDRQALRQRV